MIKIIVRKFIKNSDNISDKKVRESYGVLGGVLGVICNGFLFVLKLIIGIMMNSIAIMSDAFNNLSDMGSSLVAVIGAKLSNLKPDKEHPFGHGRIEYISSLIVSFIIMLVGFELLKTSIDKIIHPQEIQFSLPLIIILCISVLVKVWMFSYNRYLGKKINSSVLMATASDSLNDVIATSAIILTTVINNFVNFPAIDGIVGTIVALMIMYAGFEIAKDTVGMLLGTPPSKELVQYLTSTVLATEGVVGTHDLIVHDYGPGRAMASIHAEVPDNVDVKNARTNRLSRKESFDEMGILLVVHMDPISVNCSRTDDIKSALIEVIQKINCGFTIHDFRIVDGENNINLIFDMVVPIEFTESQVADAVEQVKAGIKAKDPRFSCVIQIDYDMT